MNLPFRSLVLGIALAAAAHAAVAGPKSAAPTAGLDFPCKNHYILSFPCSDDDGIWDAIGPDGAAVGAVVIDPAISSTVYAVTGEAGILRSTDSGTTWWPVNHGIKATQVLTVAIDPSASSTIYAGTNAGVFKSLDRGDTWSPASSGISDQFPADVTSLVIAPDSPATIYAATFHGLYKTVDASATWTAIHEGLPAGGIGFIVLDPASSAIVYAQANYEIFKSTDAGITWTPLPIPPTYGGSLAIDPKMPSRMYSESYSDFGSSSLLLASQDGGVSWSVINTPIDSFFGPYVDPSTSTIYIASYDGLLFAAKDQDTQVVVFGPTAFRSWAWAQVTPTPIDSSAIVGIAFASPLLYVAGAGGIQSSQDGGQTWAHAHLGVRSLAADRLAINPADFSTIYAARGGELLKTTDGGAHWADSDTGLVHKGVDSLVIDPSLPSTLYAGTSGTVYKSSDAGAHWFWQGPTPGDPFHDPQTVIALAPSQPTTLYVVVNYAGISKSTDGGSTWHAANGDLTVSEQQSVSTLAVDPTTPDVVYAGGYKGLFKSTDGGDHWRAVPIPDPDGQEVSLLQIAVDPTAASTVYVAYRDITYYQFTEESKIYKSIDGGETWLAPQTLPVVSVIAIDPSRSSRVYAGTVEQGLYRSVDGGASWAPFNPGGSTLPQSISDLSIDGAGTLRAATSAGIFEFRLSDAHLK